MFRTLKRDSPSWILHRHGWSPIDHYYMLPYVIATERGHPRVADIGVLNLLLGWTGLGWIVAFTWATIRPVSARTLISALFRPQTRATR